MATNKKFSLWGCGFSFIALALACGPIDEGDDDHGGIPAEGSGGFWSTTGEWGSGGSGATTTTGSGGGWSYCSDKAPPETYLCAGNAYESDRAGAAALSLSAESARYACEEDENWYWYYGDYGYEY